MKRIKNELKKTKKKRKSNAKGDDDSNSSMKSNNEWFNETLSVLKLPLIYNKIESDKKKAIDEIKNANYFQSNNSSIDHMLNLSDNRYFGLKVTKDYENENAFV